MDGILGLNLETTNGLESPFSQFLRRGNFPSPLLSIFISQDKNDLVPAVANLGSEDNGNCQAISEWQQIIPKKGWAIHVAGSIYPFELEATSKPVSFW